MKIPVILLVPTDPHLRAVATLAMTGPAPNLDLDQLAPIPGIEIESVYAPVAMGSAQPGGMTMAMLAPDQSQLFALRGYFDSDGALPPATIGNARVYSDPQIEPMLTCGGDPPVGNAASVAAKLGVTGLAAKGLTGSGVAIAIVDTGINLPFVTAKLGRAPTFDAAASWTPPGPGSAPGAWPVDHATMCAYDALIAAPDATLVDFPVLSARVPGGGSRMSGTLSAALAAYGAMLTSWTSGPLAAYKALVASNSWGIFHPSWDFPAGNPGRYCDNPSHPFNIQLGTLSRAGIDVIFAAGNCGAPCADGRCMGRTVGAIMGASAMPDVLTIAGCDTGDTRVGYSSQGPSIAGMYQQKPDITAYTHFLGSEAFGAGSPDSGTSAACPVTSGCVAALRTSATIDVRTTLPPSALFNVLRNTALQPAGAAGWNGDYGFGIIQMTAAVTALRL